ncbi:MAG: hypothetical protein EHM89_19645 [Acidobacteria bacterium]|jgi:hypothetical protein|nr:MAG: hypothetical protein EHM89_19645 [Acidobacteriota bacterium]
MPINRAPWNALVDDDGSNLVGTIWNKDKIKTVLLDPIDVLVGGVGGAWTVAPYVAGAFTGSAGMVWTVEAGDVIIAYSLVNKTITVAIAINTSTVAAPLGNTLNIASTMWGGVAAKRPAYGAVAMLVNGAASPGFFQASGAVISVFKLDQSAYVASTNATFVYGTLTFEIA